MASRAKAAVKKIKAKAGVKKPITSRQRVARRKNIAIAREYKKRTAAPDAKKVASDARKASKSVVKKARSTSKGRGSLRTVHNDPAVKKTPTSKGTGGGRMAKQAFAKKYKTLQKANKGMGMRKDWAVREGHTAAFKKAKSLKGAKGQRALMVADKMAKKYAEGVARKKMKMTRSEATQFSAGYVSSILRDLNR